MGNHNIIQDELWTEAAEGWADTKVKEYLEQNHEGYRELRERSRSLREKCPVIDGLVYEEGEVSLTAEEHRVFVEYLDVEDLLAQMEREYHFYLGLAMELPFGQAVCGIQDAAGLSGSETVNRKGRLLDLMLDGRIEDSEREFRSACEESQKLEKEILELDESVRSLGLSKETYARIDNYISAVNTRWLKYSEFMYRYGVEDVLALLR